MAARKSCTHMTWSEAKTKSGVGGSKSKATKLPVKRENHGKLLAAKVVAKSGPSETQKIENRQAARRARRDQQLQEHLDAKREAEKQQQRLEAVAKPHEQCLAKLVELSLEFRQKQPSASEVQELKSDGVPDTLICESKQLQYDEMLALQAIYDAEPDTLTIAESSGLEDLQVKLDEWQMNPDQVNLQTSVVQHTPIRFIFKKTIDDPSDEDWVAHILLFVGFPDDYPMQQTPPLIKVSWCVLTQKSIVVADNKPLESLGLLDVPALLEALSEQAQELIGMPCIYELLDTWLVENLFDYIQRL